MNKFLHSELKGTELFKKIILFLVVYVACFAVAFSLLDKGSYAGYALAMLLGLISAFALEFNIFAEVINSVYYDEKKFTFTGSFASFMGVCIKGVLLSIITLGIYGPWFIRNVINFMTDNTEYPDKEIEFQGTGGKLLKYIILSFLIPLIIFVILIITMFGVSLTDSVFSGDTAAMAALGTGVVGFFFFYFIGVFIIAAIYIFFIYKWTINFRFGDEEIKLEADGFKTILYIAGQYLLSVITFGLYSFAAEVTIFRRIAENVKITNVATGKQRSVIFNGKTGEGFLLLLGQSILTCITLCIYLPWAYAKIFNWFVSNLEIEGEDSVTTQF